MNPDKFRDNIKDFKQTFILKANYKNRKGKQAKTWEAQYKSIWNGRKR